MPIIQSKVLIAQGVGEFFLEPFFQPSKGDYPIWKIVSKDEEVKVNETAIAGNNVMFNAKVFKNIVYKTIPSATAPTKPNGPTVYSGDLKQISQSIPFGNIINMTLAAGQTIKEGDFVEVEGEPEILGSKDYLRLRNPNPISGALNPPEYTYDAIQEKMVIRIRVKIVRHFY